MSNNTTAAPMTVPQGPPKLQAEPKLATCEVGPFRLKGVKIDPNQYTPEEVAEMTQWARDNGGYVQEQQGLFSWRKESLRDWFILRWS
jgi:hypothetical protein